MGGHALKYAKVTRKNRDEYFKINNEVEKILNKALTIDFAPEIPGKESFGDLDVLYIPNEKEHLKDINYNEPIKDIIFKLFKPSEIVINGDVLSFDYQEFQIDMIKCKHIDFAKFYLSYGDFGAIIGRIVNHYGFKFGHEGFWINVYTDQENQFDETHSYGKIVLTTNPEEMCKFIGLKYEDWLTIECKEDIFNFIKSSRFFKPEIFESLKATHHRKARLRPFYLEFIASIGIKEISGGSHYAENLQMEGIKYFNKEKEFQEIFEQLNRKIEIKKKFNGKMIIEMGVEIKKIGEIIKKFKEKYDDDWILNNSQETINNTLKDFLK